MGACKTEAIQADLGIFRTMAYSEPEAHSEPCSIQNPVIFKTLVYSEPWHIQNLWQIPGILRILAYSESEA